MSTFQRRQRPRWTAILLAIITLTSSSPEQLKNTEEQSLCTIDPSTGVEECEAVYFDRDIDEPSYDDEDDDDDDDNHLDLLWDTECRDRSNDCGNLVESGECDANPGFMHFQCPQSCELCQEYEENEVWPPCTDNYNDCRLWAGGGECANNPSFMRVQCERSCMRCFVDTNQFGVHQEIPHEDDEHHDTTVQVVDKSIEYMTNIWTSSNPDYERFNYKCRNMDQLCSLWSAMGECDVNPGYMSVNCAPACQTCEKLDIRLKCPILPDNPMVLQPGGLNALMERIVDNSDKTGKYLQYNPKALSRPKRRADGTEVPGVDVDGPWIVQFENFLSELEAESLIAAGTKKGYERSADVGVELPDGSHEDNVNDDRTSFNAWCDEELCNLDPIVGPVVHRIANVTGTSVDNSEYLQLLRYEPGQYYRQHHDYIEYQEGMPCGPRMLTLFLYLNDVEEGGGTRFPLLDITVEPKRGSAILWPSVLDDDPEKKDFRTDHEALAVTKGIKYGANSWIHTRNYSQAEEDGCT